MDIKERTASAKVVLATSKARKEKEKEIEAKARDKMVKESPCELHSAATAKETARRTRTGCSPARLRPNSKLA